jgi:hypothetical protein
MNREFSDARVVYDQTTFTYYFIRLSVVVNQVLIF